MVATFNNYQELVDRALMIEGKQQQGESQEEVWTREVQFRSSAEATFYPEIGRTFSAYPWGREFA